MEVGGRVEVGEGAETNEKGYFKICHRERFHLHVKMHVLGGRLPPRPAEIV